MTISSSGIDDTKPASGDPTTQSVRDNFTEIKTQLDNAETDITNLTDGTTAHTNFASAGIDDNATSTVITATNAGVTIGTSENNNGQLFLSAIDNTNEGGEISFEGAGTYTSNMVVDRFQDTLRIIAGAGIHVDKSVVAGNTRLIIYDVDNGTMERVTVGAADSGGAGYKVLRIPN